MTDDKVLWYIKISFDKKVAYPGETLFAAATIRNPNSSPIYIGNCHWQFSCYPKHKPGVIEVKKAVPAKGIATIPNWNLPVPNIKIGNYSAVVSLDTWLWDQVSEKWTNYGTISPDMGEPFYIIHKPRFRAFISRSNHAVDQPIVEPIISTIQEWGFDTHTVGVNEIVSDAEKVPDRIIMEILKADCVFAIATPRDVSSLPNLFRTLAWLDNEVSFSYMAKKPTLLIVDSIVKLEGLTSTKEIPKIKFSSFDLDAFICHLHEIMPVIREVLIKKTYQDWQQKRINEIERVRFESFMAGVVVGRRLIR